MTTPNVTPGGGQDNDFIGEGDKAYGEFHEIVNVTPNAPPPQKTLVIRPGVRIIIAHNNIEYDVSEDITSVSVQRSENAVASLVFTLSNKPVSDQENTKLRYTNLFDRMDRVSVFMKRTKEIQVFAGYLDMVPFVQLYPGVVSFRASCTLKRLAYTYWDPGLTASAPLWQQAQIDSQEREEGEDAGPGQASDNGLGTMLVNMLKEVGNWDEDKIHVQRVPLGYYQFLTEHLEKTNTSLREDQDWFRKLILGDDTTLGAGGVSATGVSLGAYSATQQERMSEVVAAVDEKGMGPDSTNQAASQGLRTSSTLSTDERDQTAWQATRQVGEAWNEAAQRSDAAIICFMVIAVESSWKMYANTGNPESLTFPHDAEGSDHDSVGLYQQRDSWGSTAQRMNPRASTHLFLNRVAGLDWRNMQRGDVCWQIQQPRSDLRGKYALHEAASIEQVRGIRTAKGSTTDTPDVVETAAPRVTQTVTNAVTTGGAGNARGANALPATPVDDKVETPAQRAGSRPYDLGVAVKFALDQVGKPYGWGDTGPDSYDCSGLTMAAYRMIGLDITRTTYTQIDQGQTINQASAVPGDLIHPPGNEHVVMWLGGGKFVHAPTPGQNITVAEPYFDLNASTWKHHPPAKWYGDPNNFQSGIAGGYDISKLGEAGVPTGSGAFQTVSDSTSGSQEQIARNLYTYFFSPGRFSNQISDRLGSNPETKEKAFLNDEPLLTAISSITQASMRNFQSAPNGDFVAYFPDYFGLDGKQAVIRVEDIEMKNVQINLNDDALATHVYVGGGIDMRGSPTSAEAWVYSGGFVSVENEPAFTRITSLAPRVSGDTAVSGIDVMRKFGARPYVSNMPWIRAGAMEFLTAMHLFSTKWAEQYSTSIDLCFMPEIFPGMRIELAGHNLQVYVTAVTHSGDYTNGFTTTVTIMAPSMPSVADMALEAEDKKFQETSEEQSFQTEETRWFY
ncbi:minor tail protein [Gordonia phage Skog]|uniref:Minor tail protein n=1 Tax=Gordonia phage Skog TaxID=2704033 RepID=A0A6G6XJU7_9CAUD|nr:virion structural protein [Gordonia phage Skog]QIG58337.1 minor tail protein [Gordonia phage Skog]